MRTPPEIGLNAKVARMQAEAIDEALERAFEEDLGPGVDLTGEGIFSPSDRGRGVIVAKGDGVLAGLEAAQRAFARWKADIETEPLLSEGQRFRAGDDLLRVSGPLLPILRTHRIALNFMSHLSGVATRTRAYVDRIQSSRVPLFYTRKALPGLRVLEKHAVALGGGINHRLGLYDSIKVMDIHVKAAGSLAECVRRIRQKHVDRFLEVEVRSRADVESIADLLQKAVDRVWLDNVPINEARAILARYEDRVPFGASGGLTLDNIADHAATGVKCVSVGSGLVLEAPPIDMALRMQP